MPPVTRVPDDPRRVLLGAWLAELGLAAASVAPASEDASFRRYFRVRDRDASYIAMDAPPEREDLRPFLSVARMLEALEVHVPHVHASDEARGFLLLSDLGSHDFLAALAAGADPEPLYADAAAALLRMQSRGRQGAASLPAYGRELLGRELELFPEWFLARHLGLAPLASQPALMERLLESFVAVAFEQPQVFVHRDYHSRNLMICPGSNPGVLDFQDAVRGALCYDLASLYKDCYIRWPRTRVLGWLESYRAAASAAGFGLPDAAQFRRWFDLTGLQRHLKVLGIFARLWYRDGKPRYLADLPLVLDYVLEVVALYPETRELDALLRERVLPSFAAAQERVRA
jgi:N-acetylmuramate 1-kinase